jgi:hypothetical protein
MSIQTQADKTATDLSSTVSDLSGDSDTRTIVSAVTELAERVTELTEYVTELERENEQLREELQGEQEARARSDADIRARVHDVEQAQEAATDDTTPGLESETTTQQLCVEPETHLEDLITVPDRVLANESENTQRAAFVAQDITEYTSSVPAGRAITSGELRRVVAAGTDCNGHQQTVGRIMGLLDDLGGDETKLVQSHGTKRLVFAESLVTRLERLTTDSHGCDDTAPVGV